jgi:ATP-dependent DNA ligase
MCLPPMLSRPTFTFIPPALPSPAERMPIGSEWIHEIKHDGYRMMAHCDASGVRLLTRNGKDWTGASQPSWKPPRDSKRARA